jgi:hypothetical protein
MFELTLNILPHLACGHTYAVGPQSRSVLVHLRQTTRENDLRLNPVWALPWTFKLLGRLNALPQRGHTCFFSASHGFFFFLFGPAAVPDPSPDADVDSEMEGAVEPARDPRGRPRHGVPAAEDAAAAATTRWPGCARVMDGGGRLTSASNAACASAAARSSLYASALPGWWR